MSLKSIFKNFFSRFGNCSNSGDQNEIKHIKSRIDSLEEDLKNNQESIKNIMATQAELTEKLKGVLSQQKKTNSEIVNVQGEVNTLKAEIVVLKDIVANGGEVTPELVQAVDDVVNQAQVVDDQIPDLVNP